MHLAPCSPYCTPQVRVFVKGEEVTKRCFFLDTVTGTAKIYKLDARGERYWVSGYKYAKQTYKNVKFILQGELL